MENDSHFNQCISKSLKVKISNIAENPRLIINNDLIPIDLFKGLNIDQLQGCIASKNVKKIEKRQIMFF